MKPNTLKALAAELGLSVSTVSKALRDSHEISVETKAKVAEFAKRFNYEPNPYASGLKSAKSKTIAVVIPEIANNLYSQVLDGIQEVLSERKYHVLVYVTHKKVQTEINIMRYVQSGRVDGIIMSLSIGMTNFDHLHQMKDAGIPLVLFNRTYLDQPISKINTDDYESSLNATAHLIKNGCKDIAFLTISEHIANNDERLKGYMEGLRKHGLKYNPMRVIIGSLDVKSNFKKIERLLSDKKRPDGIFSAQEKLGIATYDVCRKLELRIPEDVKVLCFSNMAVASCFAPSMTTITQPAFEMGKAAANQLLKALNSRKAYVPEHIILKSELMIRESTRRTNPDATKTFS